MAKSNVRRLRPKEVSLVADLLAEEAESVEVLARTILRALNKYRAEEALFVRAVRRDGQVGAVVYGPYPSAKDAREDDMSCGTGKPGTEYEVGVFGLVPPYGQALSEVDPAAQISLDEIGE
jgi:hypothetical protein